MVVTEREPSPQQGRSPQLARAHKDSVNDESLSPIPSHASTDERLSPGFGLTDQELSDCPTPQTPPVSLPFSEPFSPDCPSSSASPPFPEPCAKSTEEELPKSDSGSRIALEETEPQGNDDNSAEFFEKTKDSTEDLDKGRHSFDISEEINDSEKLRDSVENFQESTKEQLNTVEISQTESGVEFNEECREYSYVEKTTKIVEESKEYVKLEETIEKIETGSDFVEKTEDRTEQSNVCENVQKEEISINQLWNLWSSNAPKKEEEIVVEETPLDEENKHEMGSDEMKEKLEEIQEVVVNESTKTDDLNDTRLKLADAERRLHEMEVEIKRLENERDELNSAYREAEALRRQEEAKAQRLAAELTQVRHEYEKRLIAKEEELEALRKQMQIEIEQLSQRVAEAEAKVKTEVARIKKKMQVQITELEMSLDVANKQNIDMQKTIKKLSLQITELQAHYDEIHRQLQQTVDQLAVSQRRSQALQAELEEMRVTLEQALRAKRLTEMQLEEAQGRVNELNTLNVNLTSAKSKLEAEFTSIQADYEEISKELRISDERYNRVVIELKSTKDLLIEEQERLVKIDAIKKSLEIEVHNFAVRLEEVEANALAGGKRVISKLESRIRDVEIELEEEKRRHVETQKVLRKKEHRIKELIVQMEEDHQSLTILNDSVDKLSEKCKLYKRQLVEQEGMSQQSLTRVRRFQRELEAAEERADQAESNLSLIRAKHRSWVTTSQVPGGLRQVIVTEETSSTTSQY